jgi:cysteine-rich repeat protein
LTLAVLVVASCGLGFALVPAACIPDLPSNATSSATDAAQSDTSAPAPRCGDGIVQLDRGEQCDPGTAAPVGCSSTCQVVCDGGFHWSHNDHCYFDVPQGAASIAEATNTRCTASHVVTFADQAELEAVVGALDAGVFWVGWTPGLAKDQYDSLGAFEPGWEPGCFGCYAQTGDAAVLASSDAGTGCVESTSDPSGSWGSIACQVSNKDRLHVICEREPQGRLSEPCPTLDGGECFDLRATLGQKHYVYVRESAPVQYAEAQCESLGGTLVVLQSRDEREQLWKELSHVGVASIWIGLSLPDGGSEWTWADGTPVQADESPWALRQPRDAGTSAYMTQNAGPPQLVDDTLARVTTPEMGYAYVCQLPARDE